VINIGIGNSSSVEQILVRWPDGTETTLKNVLPNQVVTIRQDKDASATHQRYGVPNPILFPDVTASSGIAFRHTENTYTDFKTQRLLYYQPSRMGGKLSKGDVNNDGNDDVFFGGAAGQAGELYWGNDDGTFVKAEHQPWESEAAAEDIGSVFFDVDGDGDVDLYVVSGGSEFPVGSVQYQDRLYLNDGQGKFLRYIDGLPSLTTSGSCVMAADYDKDGKPDLFVGGRHVPSRYGTLPRSFILHNNTSGNAVTLTDVTAQVNSDLLNPGMVTAAVWTDINNDTWPDLMITGEWMPVRIFMNHQGKLIERKDPALENSNGWWTAIAEADLDDDGDPDYLLGNVGLNLPFKATRQEPVQLFAGDYNNDGALDPVLCHYIQGRSYPLATRDELLDQINTLRKKFVSYSSYANATIQDIASNDQRRSAYTYAAYTLQSAWLENVGGKSFILHALPDLAQVSVIHGFVADDITGDGKKEVLAAGNFYPFKSQIGRSDASVGFIFSPGNAPADAHRDMKAKVWFTGDIRDLTICRFRSGKRRIVVARNNDKASVHNVPGN
jgi:enediyne biosynthesis protein E4